VRLAQSGRGHALRTAWSASPAEVLAYMDVDLSTDLNALAAAGRADRARRDVLAELVGRAHRPAPRRRLTRAR
jgi:hypothetical protein